MPKDERERFLDSMEPPNRVNPSTGVPYGWDEDDELDGFMQLLSTNSTGRSE